MPRIPDHHLKSVFYLYPDEEHARSGKGIGGTGFFCAAPPPDNHESGKFKSNLWLVTNRHVIEDGNWVVRITRSDGSMVIADVDDRLWQMSDQYDLAIARAGFLNDVIDLEDIHFVGGDMISQEGVEKFDIGIGDELILVGRFINWDGVQTNRPVARFGNVAQMPDMDEPGGKILAEIRSVGGFSGSPVLVHIPSTDLLSEPDKINRPIHSRLSPVLLGVNSAHTSLKKPILGPGERENQGGLYIEANTGLAVLEPSWALRDLMLKAEKDS